MSRIPQDADVKSRTLISATFKNQDKQTTVKINPKMDKDESQDKSKLAHTHHSQQEVLKRLWNP